MKQNLIYALPKSVRVLIFEYDRTKVEAFASVLKEVLEYQDKIINKYKANVERIKYFHENSYKIKQTAEMMNRQFEKYINSNKANIMKTIKIQNMISKDKSEITRILQYSEDKKTITVNYVNDKGITILFRVHI